MNKLEHCYPNREGVVKKLGFEHDDDDVDCLKNVTMDPRWFLGLMEWWKVSLHHYSPHHLLLHGPSHSQEQLRTRPHSCSQPGNYPSSLTRSSVTSIIEQWSRKWRSTGGRKRELLEKARCFFRNWLLVSSVSI